ncbi:hypothetical protein LOTGIDRAFT_156353 [Lottia gigantea]|uniref:UBC core domain-containing protein n=1 Tax=Lottia gigantea TaxID=225164 RepID=V4BCD3_LOTGI|nr:hypothetical protein LOTGIDRAFT_156353 [Lottia gigantea]ESP03792.1 hypothetical protein LOTGIDRAFT_156353 [Lottia gigantea]
MATCNLFDEDVVCSGSPESGFVYGLVIENSEFLSSSEDEDEEDEMEDERVRKGSVRVAWHPDGKETVVDENEVILVDRSLMPGDVIRRSVNGKDSQQGFVQDMELTCHIRVLGTNKYIYNINTRNFIPMEDFDSKPGEVTLDSWIGRFETMNRKVTIRMPDGARCKIMESDIYEFDTIDDKRSRHSEYWSSVCYPQQIFKGSLGDLHGVEWLHSTMFHNPRNVDHKQHSPVTFIVESVETESVEVHWLARGFSQVEDPQVRVEPPPRLVRGDQLKRMSQMDWFYNCSVQIGDRAYYVIQDTDTIETHPPKKQVVPEIISKLGTKTEGLVKVKTEKKKSKDSKGGGDGVNENGNDDNTDDDDYDDDDEYEDDDSDESDAGSVNSGSSQGSASGKKKKGRKKPSLQLKMLRGRRGRRPRMKFNLPERKLTAGEKVPVEICYTVSKANVMWQDGTVENNMLSAELYPIHHLDELEFFPGDFIIDAKDTEGFNDYGVVVSCDHSARTCYIQWLRPYEVGKSKRPTVLSDVHEVSVYDIKDHPHYKFRPGYSAIRVGGFEDTEQKLSAVGQVYRLNPSGSIQIKWADGTLSDCFPQELYLVSDELSEFGESETMSSSESESESEDESSEDNSDASWETETEEEVSHDEEVKEESVKEKDAVPFSKTLMKDLTVKMVEAHQVLAGLEDSFHSISSVASLEIADCYSDVVSLYKTCKNIDKMLKTKFFEDTDLQMWLSQLREAHRNEKLKKVSRNINYRYNSYNQDLIEAKMKESQSMELDLDLDFSTASNADDSLFQDGDRTPNDAENPFSLDSTTDAHLKGAAAKPKPATNESGAAANTNLNNLQGVKEAWTDTQSIKTESSGKTDVNKEEGKTQKESESGASNGEDIKFRVEIMGGISFALKVHRRIKHIIAFKVQKEIDKRWGKGKYADDKSDSDSKSNSTKSKSKSKETKDASPEVVKETRDNNDESLVEKMCQQHLPDLKTEADAVNGDSAELNEQTDCEEFVRKKLNISISMDDSRIAVDELGSPLSVTGFQYYGEVPLGHQFYTNQFSPNVQRSFMVSVQKELKLLESSLPPGIIVKGFEDRMDLFSAMFVGPTNTPYEDGLFVFDLQLSPDYPVSPPSLHYISYCTERLNPNLYEDGKVCISLLGTWSGKGNELWCSKSNLLQIFVSVQGLILVKEPYYNEAGYEKQRGSQQAYENSRMYNEMAILKLVQAMSAMAERPPKIFEQEVKDHLLNNGPRMIKRLRSWIEISGYSFSVPATKNTGSSTSDIKTESRPNIDNVSSSSVDSSCDKDNKGDNSGSHVKLEGASKNNNSSSPQDSITKSFTEGNPSTKPDFPLFPVSKGFCLSLRSNLQKFEDNLKKLQQK